MRRPSSIEPFTPAATVTLHPLLQSVLDNLDIQIDEELSRYRRQRRYPSQNAVRKPLSQSLNPASQSSPKSFNLKLPETQATSSPSSAAIGILNSTIQVPTPRSSIYADPYAPASLPESDVTAAAEVKVAPSAHQTISRQTIAQSAKPSEPRNPVSQGLPTPTAMPFTVSASELESASRISSYAEQNDLSVYAPNETLQKLMQQSEAYAGSEPEDYLASSEELLRSIAEDERELRAEREPNSMLETLLTPLGVGSMLLLLLSSTSLGYVMMNPSSFNWWTASPASSPASSSPASQDATVPSPNLAAEEFVDLGLDTLSTLPKPTGRTHPTGKTQPSPTSSGSARVSTAKPSASANAAPSASRLATAPSPAVLEEIPVVPVPQPNLSTVVVPSEPPIPAVEPEPTYQPIEPAPLPEAPAVSPEPINASPPSVEPAPVPEVATAPLRPTLPSPSSPENYYYVVTDYSGDSSLQEARGAVPDAYVRNLPEDGAKVQLGAFSDEAKAQELLQELEDQGIQAEVYRP